MRRLVVAMAVGLLCIFAPSAHAKNGPGTDVGFEGDGAKVTLTLERLRKAKADAAKAVGKTGPRWEYKTHLDCLIGNIDTGCDSAAKACTNGQFQSVVLRRLINPNGTAVKGDQGIWSSLGLTCFPDVLPGNTLPSLIQIQQAFRQIDFTKGNLTIQPVGNLTLVNLPTYFEATWPETGVGPHEIDTTTLLAFRLEIQPIARSVTYVYGDNTNSGPTTDLGGPHPEGHIHHTYNQPGTYPTRLDTTYGGRFRLEGGTWITIPGTITIQGTPVTLTVREAKARLYR